MVIEKTHRSLSYSRRVWCNILRLHLGITNRVNTLIVYGQEGSKMRTGVNGRPPRNEKNTENFDIGKEGPVTRTVARMQTTGFSR